MSVILHLKDEFTELKSTMFLTADEINVLLRFLIGEGTRVVMGNAWVVRAQTPPAPEEFIALANGKADENALKFSPIIKNAYTNKDDYYAMWHDFELNDERRGLLSGYLFGRYGEAYKSNEAQYDDLTIYIGERTVFESTTHEFYAAADLGGLEEKFISFGDMPERNAKIIEKLNYAVPPDFLEGSAAKITLRGGEIEVLLQDGGAVIFEFSSDNYKIEYNTGYLGSEPKYTDGEVKLTGANPCDFVSGNTYTIEGICYNTDVQGGAEIKLEPPCTFCEVYLELTVADGRHCDLEIKSDHIFVKVKNQ